jgi:hypothetical protein
MTRLFEYFWCHIARRTACCGQNVELLFVHYPRQTEISYQQVGVVFWSAEEEVFGLEISMHDAVVMEVCDCGESGTDQVGGVGFVVAAFAADSVEEFAAECEVGYEVDLGRVSVGGW